MSARVGGSGFSGLASRQSTDERRRPGPQTDGMNDQNETLELRIARLEDEVAALEREVQALRADFRAFARLVGHGDLGTEEP